MEPVLSLTAELENRVNIMCTIGEGDDLESGKREELVAG